MEKTIDIEISPDQLEDEVLIQSIIRVELGIKKDVPIYYHVLKRSLDARKQVVYRLRIEVSLKGPLKGELNAPVYKFPSHGAVHIIGAGPAGLFAALKCLEGGLKPIVIERGKDVRSRRRDLARLNKEHIVDPDSNYCFGEGGAGAYSDGKLYTRSKKRGNVRSVLETLVAHGADPTILVDAHPHIGTNKLPAIITAIRETILDHGGEIRFESKLTDIEFKNGKVHSVVVGSAEELEVENLILATGHSARDIFQLCIAKGIAVESKPFALGVRVEHPQSLINSMQYGKSAGNEYLPPASYNLVCQIQGTGVFSFCMCPGGIIAPCATSPGEIVTNGWSPSKRNNPYANSGIVVEVKEVDLIPFKEHGPLAGVHFQSSIEKKAWEIGGRTQSAPAQRLLDFINGKTSSDLPDCSYFPGVRSTELGEVLPERIHKSLQSGFREFGKKMMPYLTNEAIVVATESRSSSPVRIPRDKETLQHIEINGLYPCGEGAGYAGGIVSAAIDGQRCVEAILVKLGKNRGQYRPAHPKG